MNELDYRVAIEALENHVAQTRPIYETSKAIDYLKKAHKEALAQPEQEPFGYFRYDLRLDAWVQNRAGLTGTPFYTSLPPQRTWVGLTDEEVEQLAGLVDWNSEHATWNFSMEVEAKLKEKNT